MELQVVDIGEEIFHDRVAVCRSSVTPVIVDFGQMGDDLDEGRWGRDP